jgi:hypothetical protein
VVAAGAGGDEVHAPSRMLKTKRITTRSFFVVCNMLILLV